MSFLKVDQTLMQRRGNWSKGVLNYLMRGGSLSERCLFLSSFILLDHIAALYITKELPGQYSLHLNLNAVPEEVACRPSSGQYCVMLSIIKHFWVPFCSVDVHF